MVKVRGIFLSFDVLAKYAHQSCECGDHRPALKFLSRNGAARASHFLSSFVVECDRAECSWRYGLFPHQIGDAVQSRASSPTGRPGEYLVRALRFKDSFAFGYAR